MKVFAPLLRVIGRRYSCQVSWCQCCLRYWQQLPLCLPSRVVGLSPHLSVFVALAALPLMLRHHPVASLTGSNCASNIIKLRLRATGDNTLVVVCDFGVGGTGDDGSAVALEA